MAERIRVTSVIDALAVDRPRLAPSRVRATELDGNPPDHGSEPWRLLSRIVPAGWQGKPEIPRPWRLVDRRRSPIAQRLMKPLVIVEGEVPIQAAL
jgi:hypothetical protein